MKAVVLVLILIAIINTRLFTYSNFFLFPTSEVGTFFSLNLLNTKVFDFSYIQNHHTFYFHLFFTTHCFPNNSNLFINKTNSCILFKTFFKLCKHQKYRQPTK